MKNILLYSTFLLSFLTSANAYETLTSFTPPIGPNPINTTCRAAERLCSDSQTEISFTQPFDFTGTTNCMNGKSKLFYSFKSELSATAVIFNYSTPNNTSNYKLYGPFHSFENGCEQIEQFIAPISAQSNSSAGNHAVSATLQAGKFYIIDIEINACSGELIGAIPARQMNCETQINCEDCIGSFQPSKGQYILSAWVKEESISLQVVTSYLNSQIIIDAGYGPTIFTATGQIIDGWQRIEGVFSANSVGEIQVELKSLSGTSYFDDIRIFPYDGSMMSYVYDPLSLRLMAELDERNYAKLYEYDEEGKLIRIKKETEKGIMTIQENRDNNSGQ